MKDEIFYAENRAVWRRWLEENFRVKRRIWLKFPKKESGIDSVSYSDAVEEAICFGWIDSTLKSHDEHSSVQLFSVRNPRSSFSQLNKERLRFLRDEGLLHESVHETAEKVLSESFVFPQDIEDALREDPQVWNNYINFSAPYRRIRVAYIETARSRPEEFAKRLAHFARKTRDNKLIVGRGSEKYY